jgi:type I restriction enzyme, S subunit
MTTPSASNGTPVAHDFFSGCPSHWTETKLKFITRFHNGFAFKPHHWNDQGVPIIRIQNLNGSDEFNFAPEGTAPEKLRIRSGDMVFSWSGNKGTSFGPFVWDREFDGYLNQHIFKLDGYSLPQKYFYYLLKAVTTDIESRTHGIIGLVHVTKPELGSTRLRIPPPAEQEAIVAFLNRRLADIDRFVSSKQRLIELLEEQRQGIVEKLILGSDVRGERKPSGLMFLDSIPKQWNEKRAKYYLHEIDIRSESGEEELLSVSHITGVTPRSEKNITMFQAESYEGYKLCFPGDLVVNTMWAFMAALGVSQHTGIVSSSYAVYRQHRTHELDDTYLDALLRTKPYRAEYMCRSTGIRESRLRLYPDQLLKIPIICPPPETQRQIVVKIDAESAELRRAIRDAEREIELMNEFRGSLIAQVVTGRLPIK